MRTKRVKRIKLLKGEKMMLFLGLVLGFFILPLSFVYTKAALSESQIELEKIKYKIECQTDTNEALGMQIDELASIENIQEIASLNDLSYDNNHIITIGE